ncbi:MAG: YegP family protein [Victivallales bacterium]|nr:YegP family protein [Victivallales bacterium]
MAGKFEIKAAANGKFIFNLKAGNGEVILTSQMYKSLVGAKRGIASVKKNAPDAARFEIKTAKNGEIFFVLKARNSQIIGQSETYPTEAALKKGLASVQNNAPDAKIVDVTTAEA